VIILDYRAVVYLVASVDTEQQTQSRSTCHVQKTTNTTEINRRTTRNYALGDLSTQILKISRLLEATDSSQRLLMQNTQPNEVGPRPSASEIVSEEMAKT
jgi:hypothetical protein